MKKLILMMLVMVAVFTVHAKETGSSDNSDKSGFRIHGGVGISTMYFSDQDNNYDNLKTKIKVGGFVGAGYEFRIGSVFALQPELNYANKGAKRIFDNPLNSEHVKLTINMHTLELPILAKFYIGDHFNIYAGPYISYLVAAAVKSKFYNTSDVKTSEDKSVNIMKDNYKDVNGNSYFKRFDVGLSAGLEFVTDGGFFVGARINQGFVDLTNNNYNGYVGTGAIIFKGDNKWVGNTGVQVMAGFKF